MTTSDGISKEDWDTIHEIAADMVNAADGDRARHKHRLLVYLDQLQIKYGPRPSILATRADYVDDDDPLREQFLHQAHALAESTGDKLNLLCVAQSLVELYLEAKRLVDADVWLNRMRQYLDDRDNAEYSNEYERLRLEYRRLAIKPAGSLND